MSSNVANHRNYTVRKNIPPFLKPKPASSKQALLPARDSPLAPPVIIRVPERLAAWMSFRNTRLAGRPRLRGHPIHRSFSLSPWTSAIVRSLKRPRKPARIILHAFCSTEPLIQAGRCKNRREMADRREQTGTNRSTLLVNTSSITTRTQSKSTLPRYRLYVPDQRSPTPFRDLSPWPF